MNADKELVVFGGGMYRSYTNLLWVCGACTIPCCITGSELNNGAKNVTTGNLFEVLTRNAISCIG